MKTLLYPAWDKMEFTADYPKPAAGPGEVILKVAACGLCGSELEAFRHHSPRRVPPLVLGHEFCGEVAELGPGVSGYRIGQRVVSNALVNCGNCVRCRRGDTHLCATRQIFGMNRLGAFTQFTNVPARCLVPWPDGLAAEAACLAEPLANGVHVNKLLAPWKPKLVVVFGVGPIGLCCQQVAQVSLGARTVVADIHDGRLEAAKECGAEVTVNTRNQDLVKVVQEMTGGEGVDGVIDAAGVEATKRLGIACLRPGGAAVWIGLGENPVSFNSFDVTLPEKSILGSYASTQQEMQEAVNLLASGKIKTTNWVERFPIEQGVEAFYRMLNPKGRDIKAVLLPNA
jgi:threonine dehydrogenase-like Zn-dependent dehydrogenase